MHRRLRYLTCSLGVLTLMPAVRAGVFVSSKNLLVLRANGAGGSQETADSLTLSEYDPLTVASGTPVNTINLPTNTLSYGGNNSLGLTLPDAPSHDGQLTLSEDGHQLVFATYLSNVGAVIDPRTSTATNPAALPGSIVPRVITILHADGSVDHSTRLTGNFDYNSVALRQVSSLDGTQFWSAGNGDKPYNAPGVQDLGGLRYSTLGASTTTSMNIGNGIDLRTVRIFQGQLYGDSGSNNSPPGEHTLSRLGAGLPNSGAPTWTPLPASGAYSNGTIFGNQSPSFVMLDDGNVVLYEADSTNGAMTKYTLTNGVWALKGRMIFGKDNIENVAASVGGGTVSIYINNHFDIYRVRDVGGAGSLNLQGLTNTGLPGNPTNYPFLPPPILSAGANDFFEGISFAPSASSAVGSQIWAGSTGGSWATASHWADGVPDAIGATALFAVAPPGLTSSASVTLDANRTVGRIIFNNASASYTIAPGTGGSLTIDNTAADASGTPGIYAVSGTHSITAPMTIVAGLTLSSAYNSGLAISAPISGAGGLATYGVGQPGPGVTLPMLGSVTLSASNSYLGDTTINSGLTTVTPTGSLPSTTHLTVGDGTHTAVLAINASAGASIRPVHLASVSVNQGGSLNLSHSNAHTSRSVLVAGSLSFAGASGAWQGLLDLSDNDLIARNGNLAVITNQLASGYSAGQWNGTAGIACSAAAADGSHRTALGVILNSSGSGPIYSTFDGVSVAAGDVLVKYTYYGDADLDGDADGVDIGTWATNFTGELGGGPSATRTWAQGDWDYDGDVDGVDAGLWAQTFTGELGGNGLSSVVVNDPSLSREAAETLQGMGITLVPEPASSCLVVAIALFIQCDRRHKRSRCRVEPRP